MAWKPRLPTKTVDQAVAALLPLVPDTHIEPADIVTDEDVLAMSEEMRRQDPTLEQRGRLATIRQRARIMRVDAAQRR